MKTEYGVPFTANGFGGWFRDRFDGPIFTSALPMGYAAPKIARSAIRLIVTNGDWT